MTHAVPIAPPATLRPAVEADLDAIASLWHRGWFDGHHGHVPSALLPHRRLDDFRRRAPARLDSTTVATATVDSGIVGFVVVRDDELEQLYVDGSARGSGVAGALLRHGETVIAARHDRAWLAVVAGNLRARRFYERNGWSDAGEFDYPARTAAGVTVAVPARRYQKLLTPTPAQPGPAP